MAGSLAPRARRAAVNSAKALSDVGLGGGPVLLGLALLGFRAAACSSHVLHDRAVDGGVEASSAMAIFLRLFGAFSRREVPEDIQRALVCEALRGVRWSHEVARAAKALPLSVALELACEEGAASSLACRMLAASADYGDLTSWDFSAMKRLERDALGEVRRRPRRLVTLVGAQEYSMLLVAQGFAGHGVQVWCRKRSMQKHDGPRSGRSRSPLRAPRSEGAGNQSEERARR